MLINMFIGVKFWCFCLLIESKCGKSQAINIQSSTQEAIPDMSLNQCTYNTQTTSLVACNIKCVSDPICKSINYDKTQSKCYFNVCDLDTGWENMTHTPGVAHYNAVEQPWVEASGWQRTVILMYYPTMPGEHVFLIGGVKQSLSTYPVTIPIVHLTQPRPTVWQAYQAWKNNNLGVSTGIGTWNGIASVGTPMVWTTNDPNDAAYHPLNVYGPDYWLLDVLVRCETLADESGYLVILGKVLQESSQDVISESGFDVGPQCSGSFGATYTLPYPVTDRHIVVCGKINVMTYDSGDCHIDHF